MYMTNTFLFLKTLRLEAGTRAISVTPHAARLLRRRRIAAQPAAVSLGTTAADLSRTRVILAGRRDITIAGSAALTRQLLLTCQPAEISLSTSEAILQRTRLAGFIKTEITIEPQPVRLLRNLVLKALPATVELTPNSASFLKVRGSIEAQPQAITIQGQPADLRATRLLVAAPAAVAVTPRPAQLLRSYPLSAQPVGLVALPRPAILRLSRVLKAVKQDIALAPKSADLSVPTAGVYISNAVSSANQASYTFTAQNIGAASTDRLVVVVVAGLKSLTAVTATSCTVGGVAATPLVTTAAPSGSGVAMGIYQILVPTGTTANIVVGFSATMDRAAIAVYTIARYVSSTPIGTSKNEGTTNPSTSSQPAALDGFTIAAAYNIVNGNITWSGGLTENFDVAVEASDQFSGASARNTSSANFSLSVSGAGTVGNHVAATWR